MANEISKPVNSEIIQAPDFMNEDTAMGTENLARYIQPPRLLIVQSTSKEPLNNYPVGTPLVMPNELPLGEFDRATKQLKEPVIVVPLFFWPEFTLDNPRSIWKVKGSVRERSLDPNGEIARRSQNAALREVPCPDEPTKPMRYTTRLNYIIQVMREDTPQPVLVQFKSAEYRQGMNFNSLMSARRRPIFGCQFALDIGYRENDRGAWYGFNFTNPPKDVGPWVQDADLYAFFKEEHMKLHEAWKENLLVTEGDDVHENADSPSAEFEG